MARQATGKISETLVERVQKNGNVYVYLRKAWYDPEIRNTRSKMELKGIKDPQTGEIRETRPKSKKSALVPAQTPVIVETKANAMLLIVKHFADASGVTDEVTEALPADEGKVQKILTLAWYAFATDGRTWTTAVRWTSGYLNLLPYHHGAISKDMYQDLFHYIGQNKGIKWSIFKRRAANFGEGELVAWDSSTYACGVSDVHDGRIGIDKDTVTKRLYKVFFFYSVTARQLIAYVKVPGNIADCTTIPYAIAALKTLNLKKPEILQDNGYTDDNTIGQLLHQKFHFITRMLPNCKWIQPLIAEHRNALCNSLSPATMIESDPEFSGLACTVKRDFPYVRTYKSAKKQIEAGEKDLVSGKLNVFLYYSSWKKGKDDKDFRETYAQVRHDSLNGYALDAASKNFREKYMTQIFRDGVMDLVPNQVEIEKHFRDHGFLVIIADHEKDINKALLKFRLRETIEEEIKGHKSHTGGDTSKTGSDEFLDGELLVEFLANSIRESMSSKLRSLEQELALPNGEAEHDSQKNMKLQLDLKRWLRKNSIANILDAFDTTNIEEVHSSGKSSKTTSSTTARDRLFLSSLGITDFGKST